MKLDIRSRGDGTYDVTDEHDNHVRLRSITLSARDPRVIAEVVVDHVQVHDAEPDLWVGLEQVPTEALHAELARRDA